MAASFRFENFELEPGAYRLRQNDMLVRLERIPFDLLCLLVERSGGIVTREEILDRIWGKGVFIDAENSINTAVRKIRRALNDNADSPRFVVTIPAKGYQFIAQVVPSSSEVKANCEVAEELAPQIEAPQRTAAPTDRRGTLTHLSLTVIPLSILAAAFLLVRYRPLRVRMPRQSPSIEENAVNLPLPGIPSIAVLPFVNLSSDPEQEYFSNGLTDDLITELSRVPDLFVIARSSTFLYQGRPIQVQEVGRELGVKYILEGSARKFADEVGVNVRLVDASTGEQVWGQHYDSQFRDSFKLQGEIVGSVIATLRAQLPLLEKGVIVPQRTNSPEAYADYLQGVEECLLTPTPDGLAKSRSLLEKAITLDPGYADPYGTLGWVYLLGYIFQWNEDDGALDQAADLINRSISLDDSNGNSFAGRGWVAADQGKRGQALADVRRAVLMAPNSPFAWFCLAEVENLLLVGKPEDALAHAQKAIRLDPRWAENYRLPEAGAYQRMRQYAEAVDTLRQANPNVPWVHANLVFDYIELGRQSEAKAEVAELLRVSPMFSLEKAEKRMPGDAWKPWFFGDLRKAGLK